jgi:nucleotide-binding universal stress UspA family protein
MLSHVLVPLDGSEFAAQALEPAKQILRPGGRITLVMAVEMPQNWSLDGAPLIAFEESKQIADQLRREAVFYLGKIADRLVSDGFAVDTFVVVGEAAAVILGKSKEQQVDAIVVSTHGRSGLQRWLFGSVTRKVLDVASCPVYVIPNRPRVAAVQVESREVPQA